jgi:hypothetical protein
MLSTVKLLVLMGLDELLLYMSVKLAPKVAQNIFDAVTG